MTREEAAKLCKRIALTHGVFGLVVVADKEGEEQMREIARRKQRPADSLGFDKCFAWQRSIDSRRSIIAVAFYKRDAFRPDTPVEECRRLMCEWLLELMLHEIAHHFKRQGGHRKRWRRCFAYLKGQWGES